MSISFSVLRNDRKATLPSVESWSQNNVILKDPPKGIQTRRIDKIQHTAGLLTMIAESNDRYSENINTFALGTDPMCAVSYNNSSNNAGRLAGNVPTVQASLPYKVGSNFRPPTIDKREQFPLSRQPRVTTSQFTQPGFADFAKKMVLPTDVDGRTIGAKKNSVILRTSVKPNIVIHSNATLEPFNTRKNVTDKIKIGAHSGMISKSGQIAENFTPLHALADKVQPGEVNTNIRGQFNSSERQEFDTQQFIQDTRCYSVTAPVSHYTEIPSERELHLQRNLPTYSAGTNLYNPQMQQTNWNEQYRTPLRETRPTTEGYTNLTMGGKIDEISSRSYQLHPTVTSGGFDERPSVPQELYHQQMGRLSLNDEKMKMNRHAYEMQVGRGGVNDFNMFAQ